MIQNVSPWEAMSFRILVIEDEAQIADFVIRGLREEGFTAEHAAEGDTAWHAIRSGAWDLILLDWWLPGIDGLTLLRRLREVPDDTPVLFLTARSAVSERVRGLENGADDYLCKPFAFSELLARVRVIARRGDADRSMRLSYGDICIDLATHRASRAGTPLYLTAKEEALLIFFLRHPGDVLTRTRIYEQLWDERYDGLSNTLEVHVMGLRRELERYGPRLIQTLRGRGYVFGALPPDQRQEEL
jgi:two-component system copper resistance phosphate regulon response regulator CusR